MCGPLRPFVVTFRGSFGGLLPYLRGSCALSAQGWKLEDLIGVELVNRSTIYFSDLNRDFLYSVLHILIFPLPSGSRYDTSLALLCPALPVINLSNSAVNSERLRTNLCVWQEIKNFLLYSLFRIFVYGAYGQHSCSPFLILLAQIQGLSLQLFWTGNMCARKEIQVS